MDDRRGGDPFANQIVGQQSHPQFPADHGRRFATHVVQMQGLFDLQDVQFHVPAEAVQLSNVCFGVRLGIGQRRDDNELLRSTAGGRDLEFQFA